MPKTGTPSVGEHVEQHRFRRVDGVIVAALGPAEVSRRAGERPGNDAADAIRPVQHFSGDFAHAVKLGDRDHVFVGGDLEDAVARGVDDREAGAHVLLAQLLENFRAAGRLIAE